MLFAVTPVVTVFCLLPSSPQKRTEGSGDLRGGEVGKVGLLQQNQAFVSRVATSKLVVSTCLAF